MSDFHACGYLAVTESAGLVAVGVEAFVGVTVTRPAGGRPPPPPGTLVIDPAHTHESDQESVRRKRAKGQPSMSNTLICSSKEPSDL